MVLYHWLQKFSKYLSEIWLDNTGFAIILFILNLPSLGSELLFAVLHTWAGTKIEIFLIGAIFLTFFAKLFIIINFFIIMLSFFKVNIQKIIKIFILVVNSIICLGDCFTLFNFHQLLNEAYIVIILTTTLQEIYSFWQTYGVNITFFSLISILILTSSFYVSRHIHFYRKLHIKFILALTLESVIIIGYIGCFLPIIFINVCTNFERVVSIIPKVYAEKLRFQEYPTTMASYSEKLIRNDASIPHVIFILGESTSRNHMGIYGYHLQNTPQMDKRFKQGNLFIYRNVISPEVYTIGVLKTLFSFENLSNENFDGDNLFSILKASGYKTIWISNQESSGQYGDLGRIYASLCNIRKFTTIRDSEDNMAIPYDDAIFPLLDSISLQPSSKTFTVVHLMGTHFAYRKRYPDQFDLFTRADEPQCNDNKKAQFVAEYDNAVLYNDYIINKIIQRVENEDSIVIFVSDHGEDVYDKGTDFCGHGVKNDFKILEIPMVIWMSDTCKQNHQELVQRISDSVDRPFMTDNMIHMILDILQVETIRYDKTKSVINNAYNRHIN